MLRTICAIAALAIGLSGCQTVEALNGGTIPNISQKSVFNLRTSYDIARGFAMGYRLNCRAHKTELCISVVDQVQKGDVLAMDALDKLEASARGSSKLDLPTAYNDAKAAIDSVEKIMTTYHIRVK